MAVPFLLAVYQRLTPLLERWVLAYLHHRLKKGKEDANRLNERLGKATHPRPDGSVAWFHGASVGEAVSLLPLLNRIRAEFPHTTLLVTTGTVTAATVIAKSLPEGCIHQYNPVDVPACVEAFLDHWQPDMAVLVESEFWPNLILSCQRRKIPLYLINASMSEKSYRSWRRVPTVIGYLLSCFEVCLAQSKTIAKRLCDLGADPSKVSVCGNLKFAATPLACDLKELKRLQSTLSGRSLWVAASTHLGEETIVVDAHLIVKAKTPTLLTIIIPRHPRRGDEITKELREKGLQVAQRSCQDIIQSSTDIYLVDTIGELGLYYRLSDVAFIGGTLVPIGGHNPIEAVLLDCALIWGPYTYKQTEICDILNPVAASISTKEDLAATLEELLEDSDLRTEKISRGHQILADQTYILDHVLNTLRDKLQPQHTSQCYNSIHLES